jgi:hypothetical protein
MRGSGCDSSQLEGQSIAIKRNTAINHSYSLCASDFAEEPRTIQQRA